MLEVGAGPVPLTELPGRDAFERKTKWACKGGNYVPAAAVNTICCRRPMECCGAVPVRYRYRLCPSPGQQQALARVFGCARVVFNDSLRLREEAHAAGGRSATARFSAG